MEDERKKHKTTKGLLVTRACTYSQHLDVDKISVVPHFEDTISICLSAKHASANLEQLMGNQAGHVGDWWLSFRHGI